MNTLKRKLTAILLTFAMLFSLMPALPQAAEAADQCIFEFNYTKNTPGLDGTVKILVVDTEGNQLASEEYTDYLKTGSQNSLTLTDTSYEIVSVEKPEEATVFNVNTPYNDKNQYNFYMAFSGDSTTITVTVQPYEGPYIPEYIHTGIADTTRTYRIYYDQIWKMIYAAGDKDVSASTTIESVKPTWFESFGSAASGSNASLISADIPGADYYHCSFTAGDIYVGGENVGRVQPYNMKSLEITYDNQNGSGQKTVSIPSEKLRFMINGSPEYYDIELYDDTFHVVFFYNEEGGNEGAIFVPYAVRFVQHGASLGTKMPENPTYPDTTYVFVNWDQNTWDGSSHKYFLSSTIVNEDITAFASKSVRSGITQIHVINDQNNELLQRVIDLYNASNESTYTVEDIQLGENDQFGIEVYNTAGDRHTDIDYEPRGWCSWNDIERYYYLVMNSDGSVVGGVGHNDNINPGDIGKIRVVFTLDDGVHSVGIPVGVNIGEISTYMVDHNTLELFVNQEGEVEGQPDDPDIPVVPDKPDADDLEGLIQVAVQCTTDNSHNGGSYRLEDDTFSVSDVDSKDMTATVTVNGAPYVDIIDKTYGDHSVSNPATQEVDVKYENDTWTLADGSTAPKVLTFYATCNGTTPTPEPSVTNVEKELVEAPIKGFDNADAYTYPENGKVTIPDGGTVTLLYSITVNGNAGTNFTVTDAGAELVKSAGTGTDITYDKENSTFSGTIPDGAESVTFYVSKEFDADALTPGDNGKQFLVNEVTAKVTDSEESGVGDKVKTEAEVEDPSDTKPDAPTVAELNALLDVKVDCITEGVDHPDKNFENLRHKSYEIGEVTEDNTVEVTINPGRYVTRYNAVVEDGHRLADDQSAKVVQLKYTDNEWQLVNDADKLITFKVVCDLPETDYAIDSFDKALITEKNAEDLPKEIAQSNFVIPTVTDDKVETVTIPPNGSVTLLYSMTVAGNDGANFAVSDPGASLVYPTDDSITVNDGTFSGTISGDGPVVFYVAKTFTAENIDDEGLLKNSATISTTTDGGVDPGEETDDETVPAEEGPALPDQNALNDMLDVVLDCASNVGHADGTYKDLLENSYDFGDVTHNAEGVYTVGVTIDSDKYIADYSNKVVKVAHEIQDETPATKTVILTYNKDQGNWTTEESPVKFLIVCKGVDWDISNIEKDLVTEATLGAAKTNGVSDDALKNITVPENTNDTVIIPEDGSVTLLYAITVNGKAGIAFSVEDPETTLVKSSANVSVDENADVATYTGLIPDNGTVTFYVSKNFIVDNITENGQLVNSATVAGDDGTTVNPGTEDDPANKDDEVIDGEEEDNRPTPPPYIPGGDDDDNPGDNDGPSGLNTEDHFSYVVGYEDGMVKPQRSITRAEVATIFYRLLEDDVRDDYDTTRNNFSDVTSDSWYNQTVSTLASMGILKGYEDGTFRPNASITRAEFAAIATRFFEETGATYEPGTFTDVTGDEWFAGAIMDAVNLGLIGGYEDGTVRPNNNITRAEACAIVNRTLGRVPDADHLLPADEMTTWPDNPSSAWFYADMQEATNGHEYEWITEDGNKIEEWTDILDKDWNDR